jgi:glutathione peroxidase
MQFLIGWSSGTPGWMSGLEQSSQGACVGWHARPCAKNSCAIYDFEALSIDGKPAHLGTQRGKVLLIVNTASACGFTPQFAGLEKLWAGLPRPRPGDRGLSQQRVRRPGPGQQRPDRQFCQLNYGVSFPDDGQGEGQRRRGAPAVAVAEGEAPGLLGSEGVKWNFTKFLVGRTAG